MVDFENSGENESYTVGQSTLEKSGGGLNSMVVDSVELLNRYIAENTASQSVSMLELVSTETMGIAMHNAISTQQNAQISNAATTVAACAKILNVPIMMGKSKAAPNETDKPTTPGGIAN